MRSATILTTVFVAVAFLPASATIINIPDDYPTIQEGIDASTDGDTVLVQPGTYVENINFNGHNIVLGSLFLTTGDTSYISTTVIDGDATGSVVTFVNGEDSTAVVMGFTIQNGYRATLGGAGIHCYYDSNPTISNNIISENYSAYSGGGIACAYSSSPTIKNNIISGNTASDYGGGITCYSSSHPFITGNLIDNNSVYGITDDGCGGGIFCSYNSSPTISNNTISNNTIASGQNGAQGGGIVCWGNSNAIISNNIITGNKSLSMAGLGYGGGIYSYSSNPIISSNFISGNEADSGGAGIVCNSSGSTSIIANNIISENLSRGWCGGLGCVNNSTPRIINNTFYGNMATRGAGFVSAFGASPVLTNNIFWADSASIEANEIYIHSGSPIFSYCDIEGGWAGEGNIDVDPLFRDPENDDFHLMADSCGDVYDSPCIDAGDPAIFDSMLGCDWGLGELRSDMGAYGGEGIPTDVDEEQTPVIPGEFILSQNYPNPFNATTIIKYSIPSASNVKIDIYDILGRKVETLIDGWQSAGAHSIIWDAEGVSSGVYFFRIQAGEYVESKSCLLLK